MAWYNPFSWFSDDEEAFEGAANLAAALGERQGDLQGDSQAASAMALSAASTNAEVNLETRKAASSFMAQNTLAADAAAMSGLKPRVAKALLHNKNIRDKAAAHVVRVSTTRKSYKKDARQEKKATKRKR